MITVKNFSADVGTYPSSIFSDGATSNVWLSMVVTVNLNTFLSLPNVSKSMGRVITITSINPLGWFLVIAAATSEKIRLNGADGSSASSLSDKVGITLACDGVRWNTLLTDGAWA